MILLVLESVGALALIAGVLLLAGLGAALLAAGALLIVGCERRAALPQGQT